MRKNLKMGSLLSYAQTILSIVIGILYTPVMLSYLGQHEYGLYSTVSSTIALMGILKLGFNAGYIRYFAQYKRKGDAENIKKLNGLFIHIFSALGLIALVIGLVLSENLTIVFGAGLSSDEYDLARKLMILLTINFALSFPISVFTVILSAHEEFVILKIVAIVKTVMTTLVSYLILRSGHKSFGMVIGHVLISLMCDATYLIYVQQVLREKFTFRHISVKVIKGLSSFTIFIAINILIDQINWNVAKIVLGRYVGTAEVAVYSIGFTIYQYYQVFSSSISGVFTPRIHSICVEYCDDVEKRNAQLTSLFLKTGRLQYIVLCLIMSGFIFFGQKFVVLWAGVQYERSFYVALLLMIPAIVPLIQNIGIEIQRALNNHHFRSIVDLIMAFINLSISIVLCQHYGAIGCAIATALSLVVANGIIMNIYYQKKCGIKIGRFWLEIGKASRGLLIPFVFGIVYVETVTIHSLMGVIVGAVLYSVIYAVSMWLFGMNKDEKTLARTIIAKVARRSTND